MTSQADAEGLTLVRASSNSGFLGVHAAPNIQRATGILHWQVTIQ